MHYEKTKSRISLVADGLLSPGECGGPLSPGGPLMAQIMEIAALAAE